MTKKGRPEPANLSDVQKMKLKADILCTFPNLKEFEAEIDFLIEEHSKDRNFINHIVKRSQVEKQIAEEAAKGAVKTLSVGDPEYEEAVAKMEKARADWLEKQKKIAEEAEKEMAQKAAQKNVVIS